MHTQSWEHTTGSDGSVGGCVGSGSITGGTVGGGSVAGGMEGSVAAGCWVGGGTVSIGSVSGGAVTTGSVGLVSGTVDAGGSVGLVSAEFSFTCGWVVAMGIRPTVSSVASVPWIVFSVTGTVGADVKAGVFSATDGNSLIPQPVRAITMCRVRMPDRSFILVVILIPLFQSVVLFCPYFMEHTHTTQESESLLKEEKSGDMTTY